MNWTAGDFIFAGVMLAMLAGAGLFFLFGRPSLAYRLAAGLAVAGIVMLFWVTGAVGIIGSENEPANQLYLACILFAVVGSLVSRFRAGGMAWTMFATAGAIALIGAVALVAGLGASGPSWPYDIIGATAFFVLIFGGAGLLFRQAASASLSGAAG